MVLNTTFNNISVISWRSVLLVEETRVPQCGKPCFSNKIQKGKTCYSEEQVISMLNIFVSFGGALLRLSKRVFQNPHVIYATTRVNSFTIFLLSLFYCRQNLCQVNRQFFRRTSWWSRYVPFNFVNNKISQNTQFAIPQWRWMNYYRIF
jgi:hypothetical protein